MEADDTRSKVTEIVVRLGQKGDAERSSAEQLMPLVYDELRRLARRYMSREAPGHTLQPTALVHEAYIRMVDASQVDWQGRTHFLAVGARVMRRLLIDHARGRDRQKRGGGWRRITLAEGMNPFRDDEIDIDQLIHLNRALERLGELDERQAKIVELRFFGGLTVPEVAEVLGVSKRTVEGDWTHARAWLNRALARGDGS